MNIYVGIKPLTLLFKRESERLRVGRKTDRERELHSLAVIEKMTEKRESDTSG